MTSFRSRLQGILYGMYFTLISSSGLYLPLPSPLPSPLLLNKKEKIPTFLLLPSTCTPLPFIFPLSSSLHSFPSLPLPSLFPLPPFTSFSFLFPPSFSPFFFPLSSLTSLSLPSPCPPSSLPLSSLLFLTFPSFFLSPYFSHPTSLNSLCLSYSSLPLPLSHPLYLLFSLSLYSSLLFPFCFHSSFLLLPPSPFFSLAFLSLFSLSSPSLPFPTPTITLLLYSLDFPSLCAPTSHYLPSILFSLPSLFSHSLWPVPLSHPLPYIFHSSSLPICSSLLLPTSLFYLSLVSPSSLSPILLPLPDLFPSPVFPPSLLLFLSIFPTLALTLSFPLPPFFPLFDLPLLCLSPIIFLTSFFLFPSVFPFYILQYYAFSPPVFHSGYINALHRKKRFASFPSPAGMSLPNSSWAGIMTS